VQAYEHTLLLQTGVEFAGAWHTLAHDPQLFGSLSSETHAPLHSVSGALQPVVQVEFEHTWFTAQAIPQPPQLPGSVCVSTHSPPQNVRPLGQSVLHWPLTHAMVAPDGGEQKLPQEPQFARSLLRFTH
jgi:hypothetical protein